MAKYIYTHGKREGVVYNEYYYMRNGENIVGKRNLYVPVNTKWLSRPEFKAYIIQVIGEDYPNYKIVDNLPQELEKHTIYYVEDKDNPDHYVYDTYVFDNDLIKKICIKVHPNDIDTTLGDSGDIMTIDNDKAVWKKANFAELYSHVYNIVWFNDTTYPNIYCSVEIINNNSSAFDYNGVCNWLTNNGFTSTTNPYWRVYGTQNTSTRYTASSSGGATTTSTSISSVAHGLFYNNGLKLLYNYGSTVSIGDSSASSGMKLKFFKTIKLSDILVTESKISGLKIVYNVPNANIIDLLMNAQTNILPGNNWLFKDGNDNNLSLIEFLSKLDNNPLTGDTYKVLFRDLQGGILYLDKMGKYNGGDHVLYKGEFWNQGHFYTGTLYFSNGHYNWTGFGRVI